LKFSKQIDNSNKFYNELLKNYAGKKLSTEQKIDYLSAIAEYAWNWHTGRFTSKFIEKECKDLAESFSISEKHVKIEKADVVVLFATELYETGGHTRLLENYAEYLYRKGFTLKVVITRQRENQVPLRIRESETIHEKFYLLSENIIDKVRIIREVSDSASYLFNFQHPDDTLLTTALNYDKRPYSFYVNHADHVFWLGLSISDAILNLRPYSQELTAGRRNEHIPTFLLPVRLNLKKHHPSKSESRTLLGLDSGAIVFVIVSALWKIYPDVNYNIFDVVEEILKFDKRINILIVGSTEEDYKKFSGRIKPDRVNCYGVQSDTAIFLSAADYYLEGMPSSSLTALMEGIAAGAFPFLIWGPYHPNMRNDTECYIQGTVLHPASREDYLNNIKNIVKDPPQEKLSTAIEVMQSKMSYYCSDEYWDEVLDFNEKKAVNRQLVPCEPEFRNTLYDQRIAEQATLLYAMNNVNPYSSVIKKLYSGQLIGRYSAVRLWFVYGFVFSGFNAQSIKTSHSLLLTVLPRPLLFIKNLYFNVSDTNILKKQYRKCKRVLIGIK
jgi:hypothetical protein